MDVDTCGDWFDDVYGLEMKLLKRIFHLHRWKIIDTILLYANDVSKQETKDVLPVGRKFILQCRLCGDLKKSEKF